MSGKVIDSDKEFRHGVIEDSMNDVINLHKGVPIGPVDLQEVAALQRKIGVETNAKGVAFTPGELITATGIVMEETGAYYKQDGGLGDSNMRARVKQKRSTSYFFMGDGRWKGKDK
jgi:hypothetical protein